MPLEDHFHAPLSQRRHWQAFHNAWATHLAADLNQRLPKNYFAEPNVQFGLEIDVSTWEEPPSTSRLDRNCASKQPADNAMVSQWKPPAPAQVIPFPFLGDTVEIAVFQIEEGPELVGAVELVSPANKDRLEHRDAFVAKCKAYLQQGVGVVLVDVVTSRGADLHGELLQAIQGSGIKAAESRGLQAAAYRPAEHDGPPRLEIWRETLELEKPLPTLPLWLRGAICLPVKLEATYERTCRDLRLRAGSA